LNTDKVDAWEITPLDLRRRLDLGEPIVLVDVREPWEANIASLPGAILIPRNELEYRAEEELDPTTSSSSATTAYAAWRRP
jgi:rhodanese-related sulfurtransferase